MKKIAILFMLFAFLTVNFSYAAEGASKMQQQGQESSVIVKNDGKIFDGVKAKVAQKVSKVKNIVEKISKKIKSNSSSMQTAIILMVVGLIFLILAGAIGGSIVWAVGAIFFVIGALLLLLEIL